MSEDKQESLDLILQEVNEKMQAQSANIDALDNKAAIALGIAGVMLTVAASAHPGQSNSTASLLGILTLLTLLVSLFCLVAALWIQDWRSPPKPIALKEYQSQPPAKIKDELIAKKADAFEANRKLLARKVCWMKAALVLILVAALLLLVAFAVKTAQL
jgi:hypothetical protein